MVGKWNDRRFEGRAGANRAQGYIALPTDDRPALRRNVTSGTRLELHAIWAAIPSGISMAIEGGISTRRGLNTVNRKRFSASAPLLVAVRRKDMVRS